MKLTHFYFLPLLFVAFFSSCDKKEDNPEDLIKISEETRGINQFIHDYMSSFYLWTEEMPSLNPEKQEDSEKYFDDLLYADIDKWSFVTDDYQALQDYFKGVQKSYGYSIRPLLWEKGGSKVVAFVEFVYPNTPAAKAGLKRGDMIVNIDGIELTTENYQALYLSSTISLDLGVYNKELDRIELTTQSIDLNAEVISINPILKSTYFELRSGHKVGYLAYTSFIDEYNDDLESVFAQFKANNIDNLILDLRYNGGGAVNTARLLASMIGPASIVDEVFIRTSYNKGLKEYLDSENNNNQEIYIDRFEANPNNLDLKTLYVLTTSSTASASEMVIYTLSPYMNVVQIGEKTHGKYYGSTTFIDEDRDHGWAIQPIIMRAENVDNSINYADGLPADIEVFDNYNYELGTPQDVLTAIALDEISGEGNAVNLLKSANKQSDGFKYLESPITHPLQNDMHITLP